MYKSLGPRRFGVIGRHFGGFLGNERRTHVPMAVRLMSGSGHHEDDDGVHAAKHQVQHRVQEKAGIKAAERVVESIVEHASAGARVAAGSLERAVEHGGTKATMKAAERMGERAALRAAEVSERLAERAGERLAERAGERLAERAGERLAERAGERLAERAGERLAERAGERLAERAGERLAERAGERLAERAGERAALMGERAALGSAEHSSALVRTLTRSNNAKKELLFGMIPRGVSINLGRRALIGLPVLGGLFASYICKQDFERARSEASQTAAICFAVATVFDAVDAGFHFVLAYGLVEHWDHSALHLPEYASLGAAGISIICAIAGEIISARAAGHFGAQNPSDDHEDAEIRVESPSSPSATKSSSAETQHASSSIGGG